MKNIIKIDRVAAWILYIGMFVYFVSGFGMTQGIIDKEVATKIHLGPINIIMFLAFLTHSTYAIHLALRRNRIWNKFSQILLLLVIVISTFFFVKMIYSKRMDSLNVAQPTGAEKIFSIDELANFDGKNGNPPYVAVDGLIYDMTGVFQTGKHYSHFAGQELTNAFYKKHVKGEITKYPVVGILGVSSL
jgi:predicted heme/steroid binding protein